MGFRTAVLFALVFSVTIYQCKIHEKEKFDRYEHKNSLKRGHKRDGESPLVQTRHGTIRGKQNTTTAGTKYFAFQGIPFAKPPLNNLRFEPPQPTRWDGTWDATFERNMCVQIDFGPIFDSTFKVGDENCLYMNVYTPKLPKPNVAEHRAVMVWIHGGGFFNGAGNYSLYGPDYFLDENLVVVTFNYRLGVFGFLSTGDSVVPGNMGLKDQILALRWVQQNIQFFGGNPKEVTVMGQSAGAASVSYLVQSPLTKGLFRSAVLLSGNTLCAWATSRTAKDSTNLLGLRFGVIGSTRQIVDVLKTIDYRTLLVASEFTMGLILAADPLNGLVYAPVIEPESPTAVYSDQSFEQLIGCKLNAVPILIGFTSQEANSFDLLIDATRFYLLRYDFSPRGLVPTPMKAEQKCNIDSLGNEIKEHYVGRNESLLISSTGFRRYLSDDFFVKPTTKYVKLYSNCQKRTYLYRFSYQSNKNKTGVGHAEELPYLFSSGLLTTRKEVEVSKAVVKMWANFMKTGNPTPKGSNLNVTWMPSLKSNNYSYLDIGYNLVKKDQSSSPHKKDLDFWDDAYQRCGTRPYDTYKK